VSGKSERSTCTPLSSWRLISFCNFAAVPNVLGALAAVRLGHRPTGARPPDLSLDATRFVGKEWEGRKIRELMDRDRREA
jgi:hypothetical protein